MTEPTDVRESLCDHGSNISPAIGSPIVGGGDDVQETGWRVFSEDGNTRVEICDHQGFCHYHGPYANRCENCGAQWATQIIIPSPTFRRVTVDA